MANNAVILSKGAQTVQNVLSQKGRTFRVIELSASTRTASEAAEAIGCTVAQIIKSLTPNAVFSLYSTDIKDITNGKVISIK